ncbi:MAG: glycosyltransferase family 39 protein, partial [Candidatus Omnitrophica bacterium]|nr:glycosyltransferase family 39 protein [Candidatus Omnitrophota bacterium]
MFLVTLIIIGVLSRLCFLGQPVRYDEAYSFLGYAVQPLKVGLSLYDLPNNHLLNTLLMHVSYLLFGGSPWVIRLPAFIGGILMIPATYLLVREIYDSDTAFVTAAFVTSSSVLIEYSVLGRGYTFLIVFFLLSFYWAIYGMTHTGKRSW